jgi:hypothetical protein
MKKRYALGTTLAVFAAFSVWYGSQQVLWVGIPPASGVIDFTAENTLFIIADLDSINLRVFTRRDTLGTFAGFESRELPLRLVSENR